MRSQMMGHGGISQRPCRARYGRCERSFDKWTNLFFFSTSNEYRYEWGSRGRMGVNGIEGLGGVSDMSKASVLHFTERDGLRCFSIQSSILIVSTQRGNIL